MPLFRNVIVAALIFLSSHELNAQTRQTRRRVSAVRPDLESLLDHTLADAPLTTKERETIYSTIDTPAIHDTYGINGGGDDERKNVLTALIGLVSLAPNGVHQILVRWPQMFCGGTGNCAFAIFARQLGAPKLILESEGFVPSVAGTFHLGYPDLVVGFHISSAGHSETTYRWDGQVYTEAESRIVK
jgi:hypothetical protein